MWKRQSFFLQTLHTERKKNTKERSTEDPGTKQKIIQLLLWCKEEGKKSAQHSWEGKKKIPLARFVQALQYTCTLFLFLWRSKFTKYLCSCVWSFAIAFWHFGSKKRSSRNAPVVCSTVVCTDARLLLWFLVPTPIFSSTYTLPLSKENKNPQQFQGFPTKNNAFFCHCTRVTRENRMCTCVCLWHGGGEGDEEMQWGPVPTPPYSRTLRAPKRRKNRNYAHNNFVGKRSGWVGAGGRTEHKFLGKALFFHLNPNRDQTAIPLSWSSSFPGCTFLYSPPISPTKTQPPTGVTSHKIKKKKKRKQIKKSLG